MEIQCFIPETKFTDKAIRSVVQVIYCALFNCNLFLVLLFRLVSMRECVTLCLVSQFQIFSYSPKTAIGISVSLAITIIEWFCPLLLSTNFPFKLLRVPQLNRLSIQMSDSEARLSSSYYKGITEILIRALIKIYCSHFVLWGGTNLT